MYVCGGAHICIAVRSAGLMASANPANPMLRPALASGSVLGRGTSLIVSNATAFSHRISDDLPDAAGRAKEA